jgi:hypothetical protein
MTSPVSVSGGSGRNWVAMELAATIAMIAKKAAMAPPLLCLVMRSSPGQDPSNTSSLPVLWRDCNLE